MSPPPLRRVFTVGWILPACTVLACAQTDTLSLQAAIDTAEARNLNIAAAYAANGRNAGQNHLSEKSRFVGGSGSNYEVLVDQSPEQYGRRVESAAGAHLVHAELAEGTGMYTTARRVCSK